MIPFFFVGSRRSGTTLVCHIVNYHPRLYTPFERYIMWILHCIRTTNGVISRPSCGALAPMLITLEQSGKAFLSYLQSDRGSAAARIAFFAAIHSCRMRRGTGKWRDDLVAIGEKNPPEYADPAMQKFILEALPEAKFVHVVRHPAAVVGSKMNFAVRRSTDGRRDVPLVWKVALEANYRSWVQIEQWVLEVNAPLLTIRYEDLIANPVDEARRLYEFLGVSSTDYIDRRVKHNVKESRNSKYDLSVIDIEGLAEIMELYKYGGLTG